MKLTYLIQALKGIILTLELVIRQLEAKPEEDAIPKEVLLNAMAMGIQKHEGWILNPPSRSVRNNNPGNLVFVGQPHARKETDGRFAVFETYEDGMNALKALIMRGAKGQSQIYKPDFNLYDFFGKYAPSSDNNNPNHYAKVVASYMNVDPALFRLRDLV